MRTVLIYFFCCGNRLRHFVFLFQSKLFYSEHSNCLHNEQLHLSAAQNPSVWACGLTTPYCSFFQVKSNLNAWRMKSNIPNFPQVHFASSKLPMAAVVVFLFRLFPEHWGVQVLAASSLHGSEVIFWWDDSALQFCCAPQHCGLALRWDRQILRSTQLAAAPANCGSSPSQMFMQSPHWQHIVLFVDLLHKHT